jgi:quinoprotein glucose dehydrogenase
VNGVIVVGSATADNQRVDGASGEVRAFDVRTGALRWTWHPVPQDSSDAAYATWRGSNAHRTGAANAWSVLAADPARDLVLVPTGSASPDYYGGERLGQNRYANSITALRASTGTVVWSFQTVHHDLWDYDNASPPALVTVEYGGRRRDAVLQATKTGQLFVLDRDTGVPIVPVTEMPVPHSTVAGEEASPTQPQSAIGPLSPQGLAPDSVWGVNDADRAACRAVASALRNEGPFTPPSLEGSLLRPSNIGGAHWGGVAFDPAAQIAVVPTNTVAAIVKLISREHFDSLRRGGTGNRISAEFAPQRGTP